MKRSAALLVYRHGRAGLEVFLVHPGGPFWAKKDLGAWSIPKGEFDESEEDGLAAAKREFFEEVGQRIEGKAFLALTPARQKGGKVVHAWAVQGEVDEAALTSNEFEMEWPPKSGRTARFPEVDRGQWFSIAEARRRLVSGQVPILDELERSLGTAAS
jgi:predicted NUDIX family NTP pyrophosphohydrolase